MFYINLKHSSFFELIFLFYLIYYLVIKFPYRKKSLKYIHIFHFYVDTDIRENKSICLSKDFITIVKALSKLNGNFTLTMQEDTNSLNISVGDSANVNVGIKDKISLMDIPNEKPYCIIKVKMKEFVKSLSFGGFSFHLSNSLLSGVYFEVDNNGVNIMTSDGRRGSKSFLQANISTEKEFNECSFYVPNCVNHIKSLLDREEITIYVLNKMIMIQNGADAIIIQRIHEKFPINDIKKVYKSRVIQASIEVEKKTFIDGLNIASVTDEAKTKPILLKHEDNKLYLISSNGNAKLHINANISGEFDIVAFSYSLMLDCINNCSDNLFIRFVNSTQPIWMDNKENDNNYMFLCPVNPSSMK